MTHVIQCQLSNANGMCNSVCNSGGDCTGCLIKECNPEITACSAASCD